GPADEAACHVRRYSPSELVSKAQAAGFEILLKTSFISLLLPALYVSRVRSRRARKYDLAGEHSMSPLLHGVMNRVSATEELLIRGGIALPAGGSQLLVAIRRQ